MKTFVMGDIHGAYLKLIQCFERSGFDPASDRLIQLGDVADRGDRVAECVDELLKIRHLVAIRGNHDEWFNEFLRTDYHPILWEQGGEATARSYLRRIGKEKLIFKKAVGYKTVLGVGDIPEAHRRFFGCQKDFYVDEQDNCFVHGGFNRQIPFHAQRRDIYFWDRDLWTEALGFQQALDRGQTQEFLMKPMFREVFIGHTPTQNWATCLPIHAANVWNLDTGAGWQSGRLTIMNISTKEYWQSDATI